MGITTRTDSPARIVLAYSVGYPPMFVYIGVAYIAEMAARKSRALTEVSLTTSWPGQGVSHKCVASTSGSRVDTVSRNHIVY